MQRPASRGVHCGSGGLKGEKVELLLQPILSEDWPLVYTSYSSLSILMSRMKLVGGKKARSFL